MNNVKQKTLTPLQRIVIALYVLMVVALCTVWVPWQSGAYAPIWSEGGDDLDAGRLVVEIIALSSVAGAAFILLGGLSYRRILGLSRHEFAYAVFSPAVFIVIIMIVRASSDFLTGLKFAKKPADSLRYEQVFDGDRPYRPVADLASEKAAEKLFSDGKYEEVVRLYSNTSFGPRAKQKLDEQAAKIMLDAKDYNGVLQQYPNTQVANQARKALGGQLIGHPENYDELLAKYPNSEAAIKVKENLAKREFERIMKMPQESRQAALEEFLTNPKYGQTPHVVKARDELAKLKAGDGR